jgi:hypothetical protein
LTGAGSPPATVADTFTLTLNDWPPIVTDDDY